MGELRSLYSLLRALNLSWGSISVTSSKPSYLLRDHLQIPSHWGLKLQDTTLWDVRVFGCGRRSRGWGTNIQFIATHHRTENKTPVDQSAFQRPSSSVFLTPTLKPPADCQGYGNPCVFPPLWVSNTTALSRPGCGSCFSPFLLLCPLTTSSPGTHHSGCETVNQSMEIFQRIPSSFQLPRDLPVPSLPSISDFHLFPSWPQTSINQRLHRPPSAPTQSPQMKTFFV